MSKALLIEKSGSIKEIILKKYDETELYKKAGFKTADGFELQTEWGAEIEKKKYNISIFGKTNGRAGQENKYDFPPPVDNSLFFGACILVNKIEGKIADITKSEWTSVYEHLFGGFEDLGEDSEISEDDIAADVPRTKQGYVKDDFVVDDDDEDGVSEETSEEEIVVKKKAKKTPAKAAIVKKNKISKVIKTIFEQVIKEHEDNYLDCTSELVEEEYI